MKKFAFVSAAMAMSSLFGAVPVIDRASVTLEQDVVSMLTTIRYRLTGAPAIVTVDIQTNVTKSATQEESDWVSIGEQLFRNVQGDVNVLVQPSDSEDRVITWQPSLYAPKLKAKRNSCRAVVKAWTEDAPPDYLVVDLRRDNLRPATDPRVRYYVSTNAFPEAANVQDDVYRTDFMALRLIKARGQTFRMGSLSGDSQRVNNEDPHHVTFTQPDFYCAVYPITCGQLINIGYWFDGDERLMTDIRLDSCVWNYTIYQYHDPTTTDADLNHVAATCKWADLRGWEDEEAHVWPQDGHAVSPLSICGQLRTRTGVEFDLMTEAQWEFSCRAGTTGSRYLEDVNAVAWYKGNRVDGKDDGTVRAVGKLAPNEWGLYDMLGNVWEFCLDWYSDNTGTDTAFDPIGPTAESTARNKGRMMRGGHYWYGAEYARAARRHPQSDGSAWPYAGGRLAVPVGLRWPTVGDSRLLRVDYSLDAETIVTADVQTNRTGTATSVEEDWVSIGDAHLTSAFGDVNARVSAGSGKKAFWLPDASFPNSVFADGTIRMVLKKWAPSNPPNYLVIDLRSNEARCSTGSRERYFTSAEAIPHGVTNRIYKQDFMVMRRIPAQGTRWCMGSPANEQYRNDNETQHYVTFKTEDFYCAIYPMTCGQLALIGGETMENWNYWTEFFYDFSLAAYTPPPGRSWNAARGSGADYDWPTKGHAVAADSYLGKLIALAGRDFDIPTEAQWEFLCRAGSGQSFYHDEIGETGWFDGLTHEVGQKVPNAWGLYDLHGGLWSMVLDWYSDLSADAVEDPYGPTSGSYRVWRGGNSAYSSVIYARCAARYWGSTDYCRCMYGAIRAITPISGTWPNGGKVIPEE